MPVEAIEREFTDEQVKKALQIIGRFTRTGRKGEWPEWVTRAKRQYGREWARARHAQEQERKKLQDEEPREPNLPLREDGIVDWLAIRIAVSGARPVKLTRNERLIAVAYMQGKLKLTGPEIEKRLDLTNVTRYVRSIENGEVKDLLAALEAGDIDQDGDPLEF